MQIASLRRRLAGALISASLAVGATGIAVVAARWVARKVGFDAVDRWSSAFFDRTSSPEFQLSRWQEQALNAVGLPSEIWLRNARGPGARMLRIRRVELATGGPVTAQTALLQNQAAALTGVVLSQWRKPVDSGAMAKRNAIQPQVEELRRRYADDGQALQQALMQLYKEHDINPLRGCGRQLVRGLLVSWTPMLLSRRNQSLAERFAGTVVIVEPPNPSL